MRGSAVFATVLCGCLVLCTPALAVAPDERPSVTTLSGTGELGSRDGRRPTYTLPVGIAFDGSGRLYVADAAAQRIRVVERDGAVRTFAGPDSAVRDLASAGGFADGPALQARFNWPMGVAIGADGALYVADSMNHCVRRVAPNGSVSTFAGRPGVAGHDDGAAGVATFLEPTGIASDGRDLYVADRYAIRKVSPNGSVTTLAGLGHEPWAVALHARPQGDSIVVADQDGIVRRFYLGPDFNERRFASPQGGKKASGLLNLGDRVIGNAFGLAMLDDNTVVYTDPRTESVRLLELISGETKVLAGSDTPDGTADEAGFADGPWPAARFFAPAGIALAPDGRIAVADAGNRRIRVLSQFSRPYDPWDSIIGVMQKANELQRGRRAYRIAFVGNSQVYSDTDWSDSIEGTMERRIHEKVATPFPVRVVPVLAPGLQLEPLENFASEFGDSGLFDSMILQLNTGSVVDDPKSTREERVAATSGVLRTLGATLSQAHIPLLVVCEPLPMEYSVAEQFWFFTAGGELYTPARAQGYVELIESVARSGVPYVDLEPAFLSAEGTAVHRPLHGSTEAHFSAYGRTFVGDAIADFIARDPGRWIDPAKLR